MILLQEALSLILVFSLVVAEEPSSPNVDSLPGLKDETVTVLLNEYEGSEFGYTGIVERQVPGIRPVAAFRGIPYATPPTGDLRYKPPVPFVENLVRNATTFTQPCLQWDLFRGENVTGSEDCLYLNLFKVHEDKVSSQRKNSRSASLQPIMVFFHGVGFVAGQSDTYNPEFLVQEGVIVVTVQYRLGALGFLSTGDKLQPGNMGLLDQVEALRWVKKNAKYFGGNPDKVVLFGQSAGAVAVTLHLLSPLTKGLFHGVIIESGTVLAPHAIQRTPLIHVQRLAANLGCISGSTQQLLECIKNADPREVVASDANAMVCSRPAPGNERKSSRSNKRPPNPGPVIQSEPSNDWPTYLSEDPEYALQEGHFHSVPIVMGINRDESASAVIGNLLPRLSNITENDASYPERVFLKKVIKSSGYQNNTEIIKAAIKFEYFKNYPMSDISELRDEYITLHSDFSIVAPMYKTALYFSKKTKVYFYSFEYEGEHSFSQILMQAPDREPREPNTISQDGKRSKRNSKKEDPAQPPVTPEVIDKMPEITHEMAEQLDKLGGDAFHFDEQNRYVIHGEELLYVFRFKNPSTGSIIDIEDAEGKQVRHIMTSLWGNFAKHGSPTTNETITEIIVPWKPFAEDGPYTYRITDRTSLLISYRHRKMLFWTYYLPLLEQMQLSSCH